MKWKKSPCGYYVETDEKRHGKPYRVSLAKTPDGLQYTAWIPGTGRYEYTPRLTSLDRTAAITAAEDDYAEHTTTQHR